MNAWDKLALDQKKARTEADGYRFFIKYGFVNDAKEIINLYKWFQQDWSIRDPEGKTRLKLLKKIPDSGLDDLIEIGKLSKYTSWLSEEIFRRLARNVKKINH
jgi:hypothetical protein